MAKRDQRKDLIRILQSADRPMTQKEIATKLYETPNNGAGITNQLNKLQAENLVIKTQGKPAYYSWAGKSVTIPEETSEAKPKSKGVPIASLSSYTSAAQALHTKEMTTKFEINSIAWTSEEIICFSTLPQNVQETIKGILGSCSHLTRNDIFSETDLKKKYIKVLMWGYPDAKTWNAEGENNHMTLILRNVEEGISAISAMMDPNFTEKEFISKAEKLKAIPGLGMSTLTKLAYFFNVSIEGDRCLIFDSRVEKAIPRYYETHHLKNLKQANLPPYPRFVKGITKVSKELNIPAEVMEFILFESSTEGKLRKFMASHTKA